VECRAQPRGAHLLEALEAALAHISKKEEIKEGVEGGENTFLICEFSN
jgi:hypothetical protein